MHFAPGATDTVGYVKAGIVSDFTRPSAGGTGLCERVPSPASRQKQCGDPLAAEQSFEYLKL